MKNKSPEYWAEQACAKISPARAYQICLTTGRENIGEDGSMMNPFAKFYKIAGNWIKKRFPNQLELPKVKNERIISA